MDKTIIENIKKLFMERLQEKTNWGRNQIERVYLECQNEAILEHMNKEIKNSTDNK